LINGLKEGKLDAKGIIGNMTEGIGSSLTAEFSKSLSGAFSQAFSGGGMSGFSNLNWGAMGFGMAATLAADQMTAEWQITEVRDILEEIAQNTLDTVSAFQSYTKFARMFSLDRLSPYGLIYQSSRLTTTPDIGTTGRSGSQGAMYGATTGAMIGTYVVPGIGTAIGAIIGGVVGTIAGILGTGTKTKLKGYDSSLSLLKIQAPDSAKLYSDAIKEQITSWMSIYRDNEQLYNVLVGTEKKSKKTLLGTKKTVTYIYAQMTIAQAEMVAFLKQFGADNYGNLTSEGVKKFGEALNTLNSIFDQADRFVASITGVDMYQYDLDYAARQFDYAKEYIQSYFEAMGESVKANTAGFAESLSDQIADYEKSLITGKT
jgi:hypothetical protein